MASGIDSSYNPGSACPVFAKMDGRNGMPALGMTRTQTPPPVNNWGVNQITVTHPGSSVAIRGFRVNVNPAAGGVTVGDTMAIHGRVTISADDTFAASASISPFFTWLVIPAGVTITAGGDIIACVRHILDVNIDYVTGAGSASSASIIYGQTWNRASCRVHYGVFIEAGVNTTIDAAYGINCGGTITSMLSTQNCTRLTNFVKFDAAAGPLTALAADVSGDNTSHRLAIDIAGSTHYLAVWSSAWS